MGKDGRTDIESALDLFVGDTMSDRPKPAVARTSVPSKKGVRMRKKPESSTKGATEAAKQTKGENITTGWIGRFPGRKNANSEPKSKTTVRISTGLLDEYKDRVFVERRPLGELIERSMRDFRDRNWQE